MQPLVQGRVCISANISIAVFLMLGIWNSASLFGTLLSIGPHHTSKRQRLDWGPQRRSFVGVVVGERGTVGDLFGAPPSHHNPGGFAQRAGAASSLCSGAFMAVDRQFVARATQVRNASHWEGRAVTLSIPAWAWAHFTLAHLDPARRRLFTANSAFDIELTDFWPAYIHATSKRLTVERGVLVPWVRRG